MRVLLILLAACRHPAAPDVRAGCTRGDVAVIHWVRTCADLRDGISGFQLYRVATGEHRGQIVVTRYRDSPEWPGDGWFIAKLAWGPQSLSTAWPNQCEGATASGDIRTTQHFDSAAEALREYRYDCG